MAVETAKAAEIPNVPLGLGVPPFTPHAISVSLPKWQDNVDYEEGNPRVADAMVSGYPRFFIPLPAQKVRVESCRIGKILTVISSPRSVRANSGRRASHACCSRRARLRMTAARS